VIPDEEFAGMYLEWVNCDMEHPANFVRPDVFVWDALGRPVRLVVCEYQVAECRLLQPEPDPKFIEYKRLMRQSLRQAERFALQSGLFERSR
jgi:hypothetical protein